jgi:hypothetical protein
VEALAESLARHPWTWLAVAGLGAWHGLNPGMGWLLAVSSGMQARRGKDVFLALPPIAAGHLFAVGVALLPFVLLGLYLERLDGIRGAAGLVLVGFGAYKLARPRHPRFLARVRPSHLALWSFLMATAHGAGLMLVPVVLGLCGDGAIAHAHHQAISELAGGNLGIALNAVTVHTAAMMLTGGAIAWVVYRYLGLRLLARAWVNVDLLWAVLLVAIGAASLTAALGLM